VARILRGDVRWAELDPVRGREQAGRRPVLVLSHDVFNDRSGTVIALALTSQEPRAGFPLTLESKAVGLAKRSWIKVSQIRTLSVDRLGARIARASEEELARALDGLNEILG
jgi:mRNA interferase MazF